MSPRSRARTSACVVAAAVALLAPLAAQAAQFTLVDLTYEHKYEYASHFRINPSPETPANWKAPVDFTKGRVYGRLEVMSRPSSTDRAIFGICLESTPSYACTFSPTYTNQKVLTWDQPFSQMYQANQVDWTKRPRKVALIQKMEAYGRNIEPAQIGEAMARRYLPTTVRVVVTFVPEGETYVPPPPTSPTPPSGAAPDGGVGTDAGPGPGEGARDDASAIEPSADAGAAAPAPAPPVPATVPPSVPAVPVRRDAAPAPEAEPEPAARPRAAGGCSAGPGAPGGAAASLACLALVACLGRAKGTRRRRVAPAGVAPSGR